MDCAKWGELLDVDDQEEMCFHSKRLCLYMKSGMNIFENFKVIFRSKVFWIRFKEVPGWVPNFLDDSDDEDQSDDGFKDGNPKVQDVGSCGDDSDVAEVPKTLFEESTGQKEKQSEDPFDNHGGIHSDQEINNCNDESDVEEVPETCFNVPEGQKGNPSEDPFRIYPLLNKDKNIREHKIIEEASSLKHPPGFTPVGNLNEGHLDGGCAKKVNEEVAGDDNSFVHTVGGKENSGSVNKMSDSIGSCRLKKPGMPRMGGSILSFTEEVVKDYLTRVSDQWDGEIVMVGDFNEVRYKSERFGSNFKAHDADIFNSFIHNAGLNEVHLGGSAFTWCHKSATKMSKLDRFLVSENLLHSCSNINAISLDRYISDHPPILLREAIFDYGPIPF
uniref:RNA-directed DNA polymerase, eukaryota n=1 Tax=Tanacetum cinerariifolium TaxID=118510 RepID=A0A6L2JNX1_TANCI|nr:RNA-directed DNA polymerase, eukaryota [Tanacetum cinerariifolium]